MDNTNREGVGGLLAVRRGGEEEEKGSGGLKGNVRDYTL